MKKYIILVLLFVFSGCAKQAPVNLHSEDVSNAGAPEAVLPNDDASDVALPKDVASDTEALKDSESDAEPPKDETPQTMQLKDGVICPVYYTYFQNEALHERYFDETMMDEGIKCSDDKIYCYGDNQVPIPAPKEEGYACRLISSEDDYGQYRYEPFKVDSSLISESEYMGAQYPFCDDTAMRGNNHIRFGQDRYVWLCYEDMCKCGGKPCPYGSECYYGKCIKHEQNEDEDEGDDACKHSMGGWMSDYTTYHTEPKKAKKSDDDDNDDESEDEAQDIKLYRCGKEWFEKHSNVTCIPHPSGDLLKFDICLNLTDAEWAEYEKKKAEADADQSYEKQMMEILGVSSTVDMPDALSGKMLPWNFKLKKCECKGKTCASDTGCYKGKCVDIANLKPLPKGFVWKLGRPYCEKAPCSCGNQKCSESQWCIEGRCFDTRDVMKVDGKYIQYGLYEFSRPAGINHYFNAETQEALPRDHLVGMNNLLWLDIVTHRHTALCDDPVLPKDMTGYQCVVSRVDNGCNEAWMERYAFNGWHCMADEGCACGEGRCSKYARCYHGQCVYDSVYMAMACGIDQTMFGGRSKADMRGWCKCGASLVPPYMNGYICNHDWDEDGMKCWLKAGCACGDVTCKYGDYCLEPGKCADEEMLKTTR